ncbi:MAG: choice-of-anchor D domain-containing protein [Terriglobales bacterium]|jgi:hypothetical protein
MFRKFAIALMLLEAGLLTGCGGGTGIANNQPGPGNSNGTNAGTLSANASTLTFGSVTVGDNKTTPLTLTNTSASDDVSISGISVSGTGFSLSSSLTTPFTLAAGKSTNIGVTFLPTQPNSDTGTLTIASNASDTGNLIVGLAGQGLSQGQIGASPTDLELGNVTIGTTATGSVVISNSTGGGSVTLTQINVSGAGFSVTTSPALPLSLGAGQGTTVGITFAAGEAGAATGSLSVVSDASNPDLVVNLGATGIVQGQLSAQPSSLSLPAVGIGQTSTGTLSLNNSENQSVTVSQISISGTGFAFTTAPTLPLVITAGGTSNLGVSFTPNAAGTSTGNITVNSDAFDSTLNIGLSGDGLGSNDLGVSPPTLAFGSVQVNTNKQLTGTLTSGGTSIVVSSANWTGAGYSVSGISFPVTVNAGQSVPFTVTFAPSSAGAASGSVSFVSSATNSPTVQTFTGTGTLPPNVALTWTDGGQVAGYNVYRGTTSGGPYPNKLNSSLVPQTNFTDTTVQSGSTYYYVTTAVNSGGQESAYSDQASASVP